MIDRDGRVEEGFADAGTFVLAREARGLGLGAVATPTGPVYLVGETEGAGGRDAITVRLSGVAEPGQADPGAQPGADPGGSPTADPGADAPQVATPSTAIRVKAAARRGRKVRFTLRRPPDVAVVQRRFARLKRNGDQLRFSRWSTLAPDRRVIGVKTSRRRPGVALQVRAVPETGAVRTVGSVWLVRRAGKSATCRKQSPRRVGYRRDGRATVTFDKASAGCTRWRIKGLGRGVLDRGVRRLRTPVLPQQRTLTMHVGRLRMWLRRS
jgi:hypothetical protein